MSQIISLLNLIAKGINALAGKIKLSNAQDSADSIDADPGGEFVSRFGLRKTNDGDSEANIRKRDCER